MHQKKKIATKIAAKIPSVNRPLNPRAKITTALCGSVGLSPELTAGSIPSEDL
jgi:hypothetical protein